MTKKVLVTGFTSRQCNPAKNSRDVMISWLIAEACRDLGYEVEHRNPTLQESYDDFDHVFWGMAPLHGLGSNRTYGALSCFLKTYPSGRISFYQDNIDNQNVMGGIRTVYNDPKRLVKTFFNYKLEYDLANTPEWSQFLRQGVEILHDYAWPKTIIPAFPWADVDQLVKPCPNLTEPVPIDFTSYLPVYEVEAPLMRKQQWIAEVSDPKWLGRQRASWYVQRYGKGWDKRPDDAGLVADYAESWGVLDRGYDHGWWTSRLGMAVENGAVYVTRWQNVEALGDAFAWLPDAVEELDGAGRDELAQSQHHAFHLGVSPRKVVRTALKELVEK